MLTVRNCCYVAVCSAARGASAPKGEERGGGIPRRPPVYSLLLLLLLLLHCAIAAAQCIVIGPVCLWVMIGPGSAGLAQMNRQSRVIEKITYSVI